MIFGRFTPIVSNSPLPLNHYSPIINQPILYGTGFLSSEPNWKVHPHTHSEYAELVLVTQGQGYVHIGGKVLPYKAGDILAVNPGIEHFEDFSQSEQPCILYSCQFGLFQIHRLPYSHIIPDEAPSVISTGALKDAFLNIFSRLFEECCKQSFGYEKIAYVRLESLILMLYRLYKDYLPSEFYTDDYQDNIAVSIKGFIDQNIHTDIELRDISEALEISESYLTHVFTSFYNISPIHYLIGYRINEAMQMLRTSSLSIKEIADRVGFRNLSNFYTHFKQQNGISPSQFRKKGHSTISNPYSWNVFIHQEENMPYYQVQNFNHYYYSLKKGPFITDIAKLEVSVEWQADFHSHPSTEFLFVTHGRGHIYLGGKGNNTLFPLCEGDLVIIKPGIKHYERYEQKDIQGENLCIYSCIITDFETSIMPSNYILPLNVPAILKTGEMKSKFLSAFTELFGEHKAGKKWYAEICYNLSYEIIILALRLLNEKYGLSHQWQNECHIDRIKQYVDAHYMKKINSEIIAKELSISRYTLFRILQKSDCSLIKYINNKRINAAKKLISEGTDSLQKVAFKVGYSDYSSFFTNFRKIVGLSPKEYLRHLPSIEQKTI
jgi:AraC-like DNA-binding protein/quercetin dioxygenase-like cupin family protein